MNEDTTQNMRGGLSFEKQVLSILNYIQGDLKSVSDRVVKLEAKSFDTKPIWETALKEISDLGVDVREMRGEIRLRFDHMDSRLDDPEGKIDVLNRDLLQVRSDQNRLDRRLRKLEEPNAA